ncbi:MAG: hypothetical protein PHV23_00775 [Candidatus Gracilibacteria bacterium]|nr:hypothetical protein [Candidatus Gracilibacteria bacterium]
MENNDTLKIGKEIIFFAATYEYNKNKINLKEALEKIKKYKSKLNNDDKYSKTVLGFLNDIEDDIVSGRKINIDLSKSDDYLENYFLTKNEINIYNNLILKDKYREIFDILQSNNIDFEKVKKCIIKINNKFLNTINQLDSKIIAKNLLIFTLFTRNLPSEAFVRLDTIISKFSELKEEKKKLSTMSKKYNLFLKQVVSDGINFYNSKTYNYNFLNYKFVSGELEINNNSSDASKVGFRSGNPDYEYKKLLFSITKKH